eukprot:GDKI01032214.1.p1 GENE.GDKI01032214.1~~GDKI01032214.1.p1  ORF type:complete len:317 (+),score=95.15 GDKI01032214.1:131-1081(+)
MSIVKIQHHERSWHELSPYVQAFLILVPILLALCLYITKRTRSLVWISSLSNTKRPAVADPFVSSWLLTPLQLGSVRLGFFLWTLYVWKWRFDNPPENAGFSSPFPLYAFYTLWNYFILEAFFLFAAVYSFVRMRAAATGLLWNFVRGVLWTLYQQQLAASILVAVVFWVGVWPNMPPIQQAWFTRVCGVNMHGVSTLMMLFEMGVNGLPVHLPHAVFLLAGSTLYLFFGVFVFGCLPSMAFLDLALDKAGVFLFGILVAHFVFYLLAWWLSAKKFQLLNTYTGRQKRAVDIDTTYTAPAKFQWPPQKPGASVAGN